MIVWLHGYNISIELLSDIPYLCTCAKMVELRLHVQGVATKLRCFSTKIVPFCDYCRVRSALYLYSGVNYSDSVCHVLLLPLWINLKPVKPTPPKFSIQLPSHIICHTVISNIIPSCCLCLWGFKGLGETCSIHSNYSHCSNSKYDETSAIDYRCSRSSVMVDFLALPESQTTVDSDWTIAIPLP